MKILYAEDDKDLRDLYSMKIEANLNLEVVECSSGEEAIKYLKSYSNEISLIISDYEMPGGNGNIIYDYINKNKIKVPFVLLTTCEIEDTEIKDLYETNPNNMYLKKPITPQNFIEVIRKTIGICIVKYELDYFNVKVERFLRFNSSCSDIYIKISDDKYLKVINADEVYDHDFIKKYIDKGIQYFHIERKNLRKFNEYYEQYIKVLLNKIDLSVKERISVELEMISSVHDYIKDIGFNEDIISTIDTVIRVSVRYISNCSKEFGELMNRVIEKRSYIYEHSLLISYVSGAIAVTLNWSTESTLEKLSTAALLHDLLIDDCELAAIMREDDFRLKKYSHKDQKLFLDHSVKMSDMIQSVSYFSPNIDNIVFSHHENPEGSGFPRKLTSLKISPLTATFILAEDFVNRIYFAKDISTEIAHIIPLFKEKYHKGNYKKPLQGFLKFIDSCNRV